MTKEKGDDMRTRLRKIGNTWSEREEEMKTCMAKRPDTCICLGGKNIAPHFILRHMEHWVILHVFPT